MPSQPALDLIDYALKATTAYERPDLGDRLKATRRRIAEPGLRVLVVGEFKQGKSALINNLVGIDLCPVDDDISTSVTTVVQYSPDRVGVTLVRARADGEGEVREDLTDVTAAGVRHYVSEAGNPGNRENLRHVEVRVPAQQLQSGLVLIDTPGVGGLGSAHAAMTMAALPTADAVLLVSDAATEYTAPELLFLQQAKALCPNLACVVTKIDLYPEWRRITGLDTGHLERAGVRAELLPVSSLLRSVALSTKDKTLNDESGFPALWTFLRDRVLGQAEVSDRRSASHDVRAVTAQMAQKLRSELAAQQDPVDAETLIADLKAAKERAEDLKKRSARWQTTLNDGVAELQSDIDHDLRDRMRSLTQEAERRIDESDPAEVWEQFVDWAQTQVAQAAGTNFVWANQRARYLAGQVAELFAAGGEVALPDAERRSVRSLQDVNPMVRPDMERFRFGSQLFTGIRGGQQGLMMLTMIGTLSMGAIAVSSLVPFGGIAGVALGIKTVRDERKRLLDKRRIEAKTALRKYFDEVSFHVTKDSRDLLRDTQRSLRDHFTDIAQEIAVSMGESVAAAQAAVQSVTTDREQRIKDLETEIGRLDDLDRRAGALVADVPTGR